LILLKEIEKFDDAFPVLPLLPAYLFTLSPVTNK